MDICPNCEAKENHLFDVYFPKDSITYKYCDNCDEIWITSYIEGDRKQQILNYIESQTTPETETFDLNNNDINYIKTQLTKIIANNNLVKLNDNETLHTPAKMMEIWINHFIAQVQTNFLNKLVNQGLITTDITQATYLIGKF